MDRKEIEERYEVSRDGRISSPGKFEGELVYLPYFYALLLEQGGEECDNHADCHTVTITSDDRHMFPELHRSRRKVHLWENEYGFVHELFCG